MRIITPDEDDRREMAGRLYETIDLLKAIEAGRLQTLEQVVVWAQEASQGLLALMELSQWVMNERCCVDIAASIQRAYESSRQPAEGL